MVVYCDNWEMDRRERCAMWCHIYTDGPAGVQCGERHGSLWAESDDGTTERGKHK
jgi:hypothetical protein